MGILNFVRGVRRQLFNTDAEAADNIKQYLEIRLTGISDVDVDFDDGVATISGDCESPAVREQVILLACDLKGVKTVVADNLAAPEPEATQALNCEIYEIRSGDTLAKSPRQSVASGNTERKVAATSANSSAPSW